MFCETSGLVKADVSCSPEGPGYHACLPAQRRKYYWIEELVHSVQVSYSLSVLFFFFQSSGNFKIKAKSKVSEREDSLF